LPPTPPLGELNRRKVTKVSGAITCGGELITLAGRKTGRGESKNKGGAPRGNKKTLRKKFREKKAFQPEGKSTGEDLERR